MRHERIQSRVTATNAFETALNDANILEYGTQLLYISLPGFKDVTLFGSTTKEIMPFSVIASSYLILHRRGGNETPVVRLSLLDIINATRANGIGFPINWNDMDLQKSRVVCENQAEFNTHVGKVFEFGVWFIMQKDANGVI